MSNNANAESPMAARLADAARAQDEAILAMVAGQASLNPQQVHDVRVAVKRLRAWWTLAATQGRKKQAGAQDKALREVARRLGSARDLKVMGDTLSLLSERSRRDYEHEAVNRVRDSAGLAQSQEVQPETPAGIEDVFTRDRDLWANPVGETRDAVLLEKGFGRFYSRTRQLGFEAIAENRPEIWHRFRKRVKSQLYQLEPIGDLLDDTDIGLKDLTKLGKKLGELHDLHVLDAHLRVARKKAGEEEKEAFTHVRQMISRRESGCLEDCEKRTRRFFGLKPKAFRKALARAGG